MEQQGGFPLAKQASGAVLKTGTGPLDKGQRHKIIEEQDEEVKNVHMKEESFSHMQEKNVDAQKGVKPRETKVFNQKLVRRENF